MMGGGLLMILFLGALIYLALPFLKKEGFGLISKGGFGVNPRGGFGLNESAEEMLKKRYAGGEISKEEFERMKKDITN